MFVEVCSFNDLTRRYFRALNEVVTCEFCVLFVQTFVSFASFTYFFFCVQVSYVLNRSNTGIVLSNPAGGMDVCRCLSALCCPV